MKRLDCGHAIDESVLELWLTKMTGQEFEKENRWSQIAHGIKEVSGHSPRTIVNPREARLLHTANWALEELGSHFSTGDTDPTAREVALACDSALKTAKALKDAITKRNKRF